jgi:PAS domain S-box-containing protein
LKNLDPSQVASNVVNHISAMIAFWDVDQVCLFSNEAYQLWFGRSPAQMKGTTLKELLGPIYEKNLPYILAALKGEKQVFERQIPWPDGSGVRECIATYTPYAPDGVVLGFSVHVADVTILRQREAALEKVIQERDQAQAEAKTLRGLLPICGFCKAIRDENGKWEPMESYISNHSEVLFSHSFCPQCGEKHYGDLYQNEPSA